MHYFVEKDSILCLQKTEFLPSDLEALYQTVREKYTIEYKKSDWADDDSDAGWGYSYNNSYSFSREPYREEMIIKNGELVGFYVGSTLGELDYKRILPLKQGASVYNIGTYSSRYGNSQSWMLRIEENPAPSEYVFLRSVPHKNAKKRFLNADFSKEFIKAIEWQCFIEDTRGNFGGASRFKLRLTSVAIKNPDRVLARLGKYDPVMVRE